MVERLEATSNFNFLGTFIIDLNTRVRLTDKTTPTYHHASTARVWVARVWVAGVMYLITQNLFQVADIADDLRHFFHDNENCVKVVPSRVHTLLTLLLLFQNEISLLIHSGLFWVAVSHWEILSSLISKEFDGVWSIKKQFPLQLHNLIQHDKYIINIYFKRL